MKQPLNEITPPIRALHIEDNEVDAELIQLTISAELSDFNFLRVYTEKDLRKQLKEFSPHIILSDYSMPGFSGNVAQRICREMLPDVPFIFVSGTIGEERAIEALKNGAIDYVLKDNLTRLPHAVRQALIFQHEQKIKVRQQEELKQLAMVANKVDNGVIIFNEQFKINWVNAALERVIGYTLNDLEGLHPVGVFALDDQHAERIRGNIQQLMEGQSVDTEIQVKCKDGTMQWVSVSASPVMNEDGTFKQAFVLMKDISMRKQAELDRIALLESLEVRVKERTQALEDTNRMLKDEVTERVLMSRRLKETNAELANYKIALDESSIVVITDKNGRITAVNQNTCNVSKYSEYELIGQEYRIVNSGYHSKDFFTDMWNTIGKGTIWKKDVKNRAKDGTLYWVDTTIVPFLDADGKPYQYMSIKKDITARKNGEEELKKHAELLRLSNQALSEHNAEITDSINYAKLIQNAFTRVLHPEKLLVNDLFVLDMPKDVLSGDFHWGHYDADNNCSYIALGDCTGHGIPGALMTILSVQLLEQYLVDQKDKCDTKEVIMDIDAEITDFLGQSSHTSMLNDGLELALFRIDHTDNTIYFTNIGRDVHHCRNGEMKLIRRHKAMVGGAIRIQTQGSEVHSIKYEPGDRIYVFSDGYADQFGGERDKKLMRKQKIAFLEEIQCKPFKDHHGLLKKYFLEWKGDNFQVDDVITLGLEL